MNQPAQYSSPPCLLGEVNPQYMGLSVDPDPADEAAVKRWRKAERARLLAARQALGADLRHDLTARIVERLQDLVGDLHDQTVALYWPLRAEPDLRAWMGALDARGVRCALPVVIERGAPMQFRRWTHGARLTPGVWNIPIPADGESIVPDLIIAPAVGFDTRCYRLGYGGGYYDRTLAELGGRPRTVGVAFEFARLASVYPMAHDIPLSAIVTESATLLRD